MTANAASTISDSLWRRCAAATRLPLDAWSDAWMLIHGACARGEELTETLVLAMMRVAGQSVPSKSPFLG